jgi:hypothetical protein
MSALLATHGLPCETTVHYQTSDRFPGAMSLAPKTTDPRDHVQIRLMSSLADSLRVDAEDGARCTAGVYTC